MRTIRILRYHGGFFEPQRARLDLAARRMNERTGYRIIPTDEGFAVSGLWQGKFLDEDAFANRIARDLQLASGLLFDNIIES